jgi:hypothetical protein
VTNRAGRKGWAGEAPVLAFLISRGYHRAYRLRAHGSLDKGDIGGIDGAVIEIKNHSAYKLAEWMKETAVEKVNAAARIGALVIKPKGVGEANINRWWVMMTLEDFAQLMIDAGYGPRKDTG